MKNDKLQETYDFSGKDPKTVLSQDEIKHFKEGMSLKNKSIPADQVDMKKAVQSVSNDLDRLFP
jgi:hypothetical protein